MYGLSTLRGAAVVAISPHASACVAPEPYIDPPELDLEYGWDEPPPPGIGGFSDVTITNGAGKTLYQGKTDVDGKLTGELPDVSDYDGTLNIRVERRDGSVVEDTVTHEAGKAVKLTFRRASQDFTAETVQPQPRYPRQFGVAIDGAYSFGSTNTEQDFSGSREDGSNAGFDQGSVGLDGRWHPGSGRFFAGAWGRVFLGDGETGLDLDNHPPSGEDDTGVSLDTKWFVMPYVGYDFVDPIKDGLGFRVSGYIGARFEETEIKGTTDESGGGGVAESFSDDEFYVAPTVGIEIGIPIYRVSGEAYNIELKLGAAVDYVPSFDVSGMSSTFGGFDYEFETEDTFRTRVLLGIQVQF